MTNSDLAEPKKKETKKKKQSSHSPPRIRIIQQTLYTRQYRHDIISRTPTILKDIQTKFSIRIDVGVKHLADEFDAWRLVRVGFVELEEEAEGSVFERGVGWRLLTGRARRGRVKDKQYFGGRREKFTLQEQSE